MDCVICTANPSSCFTFEKTGDIAVVPEKVLNSLCN